MKGPIFALGLWLATLSAVAQSYPQEDPSDAAQHGVARLSLANGSVDLTRGDSGEHLRANVNEPLVAGDGVATGEGSRSEVQFDSVAMIRLGANTNIYLGDLQYRRYLVEVEQGTTLFRVLRDSDARMKISTPNIAIAPLGQGIYRVSVHPDGSSEITVRAGEADLISPSGTERLSEGQTIFARGPADDPEIMNAGAPPYDEWDRWNSDRDRFFERTPDVSRYAGPDIDGAQELAAYGRWVWDPSYGYVWVPGNVAPDWAPYRDGRWDYLDYYGWSWTSYDPWGWAPYHYGNWYRGSFGWAWYPGVSGPRHYWRPAMVGFFGFGSPGFGASLGFGYGNVGWVPLAPYERYRPWYGRGYGGRYGTVVNNTNIVNIYRNARIDGAATGLRAADFGRTGVGRNAFVRPDSGDLARAGMVNGGVPFAPARNLGAGNTGRQYTNPGRFPNNDDGRFSRGPGLSNAGSVPNRGGWRRLESQPSAPAVGGNRSDVRILPLPREPQPVRISPPIVTNRNAAAPGYRSPSGYPVYGDGRNNFGSFGGPRPNTVPGFGAPSAPPGMPVRPAAPAARDDGGFYRVRPAGSAPAGFETPRANSGGSEYRTAPPAAGGGGNHADAPRGSGGGGGFRGAPPSGGGGGGGRPQGNGGGHGDGRGR